MIYALLDFDGIPVRYFDYPPTHTGTVPIERGYAYYADLLGEALL